MQKIESPSFHVDDVIFQSHIHQPKNYFCGSFFFPPPSWVKRICVKDVYLKRTKKFTLQFFFFFCFFCVCWATRAILFWRIYCIATYVGGHARSKISLMCRSPQLLQRLFYSPTVTTLWESSSGMARIYKNDYVESNHRYQIIVFRELHLEMRSFCSFIYTIERFVDYFVYEKRSHNGFSILTNYLAIFLVTQRDQQPGNRLHTVEYCCIFTIILYIMVIIITWYCVCAVYLFYGVSFSICAFWVFLSLSDTYDPPIPPTQQTSIIFLLLHSFN